MWNPIKIFKLTRVLWKRGEGYDNENLQAAATVAVELNSQFEFPSNIKTVMFYRGTERGRDILWGRKDKSREYQMEKIIPHVTNKEVMNSYAPNTVGAHYQNLINNWSFEELWTKRFEVSDDSWRAEVRSNVSRHVFLCHDFQHILFRYDTSQMGESCIQAITNTMTKHFGPKYASYMIALRLCQQYKSWQPIRVLKEAYKLADAVDPSFWLINPLEIIDMDIEEARKKYNIGVPVEYLKFASEHKDNFRFDQIHPEYNDKAVEKICL